MVLTMTGLDHRVFRYLLVRFQKQFLMLNPYGPDGQVDRLAQSAWGCTRSLSPTSCLGQVFSRYRTRGSCISLCMLFGITPTVCHIFLRFSRRMLLHVLSRNGLYMVKMPTDSEISTYQDNVGEKCSTMCTQLQTNSNCTLSGGRHSHSKYVLQWMDSRPSCGQGFCICPK